SSFIDYLKRLQQENQPEELKQEARSRIEDRGSRIEVAFMARSSILDSLIAPQFLVVDLQAAQHSLEDRAEIVILVVGGDEDRVDDVAVAVAVFEFTRIDLDAFAAPGRRRAPDERQGDDWRSVD